MISLKQIGKPFTLVIGTFFALASARLYDHFFSDFCFGVLYLLSSIIVFGLICIVHCTFFEKNNKLTQYTQSGLFRAITLLILLILAFTAQHIAGNLPGHYHDLYYYYIAVFILCLIVLTVHKETIQKEKRIEENTNREDSNA